MYLPNRHADVSNSGFDPAIYGAIHDRIHTEKYLRELADHLEAVDLGGASPDQIREALQHFAHLVVEGVVKPK